MHERLERAERARGILKACGIQFGAQFDALSPSQVGQLLAHLDQHRLRKYGPLSKYGQPSGDVNLRVRSFYELLQRRAESRTSDAATCS
jgi:hypothetical protein